MVAWLTLVTPYLPEIIKLARPLFTVTKSQDKTPEQMAEQILELQNAVTQNTEAINAIALEMKKTIDALEIGTSLLEKRLRQTRLLAFIAVIAALSAWLLLAWGLLFMSYH